MIRNQFGTCCINSSSDRRSHSTCGLEPNKHSPNTVFVVFKGVTCTPETISVSWDSESEIFEANNPDCGFEIFEFVPVSCVDWLLEKKEENSKLFDCELGAGVWDCKVFCCCGGCCSCCDVGCSVDDADGVFNLPCEPVLKSVVDSIDLQLLAGTAISGPGEEGEHCSSEVTVP